MPYHAQFSAPSHQKGRSAWGPSGWMFLHSVAASYKPENAQWFKMLLFSLVNLLPCSTCGKNLHRHLTDINVDSYLNSRDDVFLLLYTLHDMTNKELGKSSPPYEQVKDWYIKNIVEGCSSCSAK